MDDIKFEDAFQKLEHIVDDIEGGGLTLDQAIKKYQEGVALAGACRKKLDSAKSKIEVLIKSRSGKAGTEEFAVEDEGVSKKKAKKKNDEELY